MPAPLHNTPLAGFQFTLNTAGVAGFFGGQTAISAMGTVHFYRGRRWLGWFNSPGGFTIAQRFCRFANSRYWDALFPGPNDSLAVWFGFDGEQGPKYTAAISGLTMYTGHLAYLTMKRSKGLRAVEIAGRKANPFGVSYLAMKRVNHKTPIQLRPLKDALLGLIPIIVSVVACVLCALVYDWYNFSMILLGIVSSGWASFAIGQGKLVFKSVRSPFGGTLLGHGILAGEDEVVVIKGNERDVDAITRSRFDLKTDTKHTLQEESTTHNYAISVCCLLLIIQFFLQLLLVPQGSLFGQIMFLVSLAVSWVYNYYLSLLEQDKDKIKTDITFQTLGNPDMVRFRVGTRTSTAVFACLLLFDKVKLSSPLEDERKRRERILQLYVPNDTDVLRRWSVKVVEQLLNVDLEFGSLSYLENDEEDGLLSDLDRALLEEFLEDARSAFRGYFSICEKLPVDSSIGRGHS